MGDGITIFSLENNFSEVKKESEVVPVHAGMAYSGGGWGRWRSTAP